MENKALLIKAPSSIDADLLKYDEIRIKIAYPKGYNYTNTPIISSKVALTAEFISTDNMKMRDEGDKAVNVQKIDTTKEGSAELSVRPFDENVLNISGNATYRPNELKTAFSDSLDMFEGLTNLTQLGLGNGVTGDIASLKGLTNLTHIGLGNGVTGDIASLKGLTNLIFISLGNGVTGDIASLKGLTNLTYIALSGGVTGDIASLKGLTNLTYIDIRNQRTITGDIASLKGLTNLTILHISGNPIAGDITEIIANCTKLTSLWIPKTVTITDEQKATLTGRGCEVWISPV